MCELKITAATFLKLRIRLLKERRQGIRYIQFSFLYIRKSFVLQAVKVGAIVNCWPYLNPDRGGDTWKGVRVVSILP